MTIRRMIIETSARVEWDEQVTIALCDAWDCGHGDAAGGMEAKQVELDVMYARGATVAEAVAYLNGHG